jgi:hypothetical protein
MKDAVTLLSAAAVGLGIAVSGWFIGHGFFQGRAAERFVTVKGVSERDVLADIALWPLRFVSTHDDLGKAQSKIKENRQQVLAFLEKHGIDATAVEVHKLEVNDLLANPYRNSPAQSRYIIAQTLMVRTTDPEKVHNASQRIGELVEAGVILSTMGGPDMGPNYLFTRLNTLKPEMIAEATANARQAAEQFAADSGSQLGNIRRANQGVFVILPRDRAAGMRQENQRHKTIRVVSTIEYDLKD